MKKIKIIPLLISIAIALGAGVVGNLLGNAAAGYENLIKPAFAPPGIVFPIVWTILYIFMGIAAYLVYESDSPYKMEALRIYGLQLFVNALWPLFFFRFEMFFFAFWWLILLLFLVIITAKLFYQVNPMSGYLMIPYILWLLFAAVLNYSVYLLNK